jgi:aminopeptidase N
LRGLGELEDERAIDVVLPWSHPGRSRWTRDYAMRALAALGRSHPPRARVIQDALEAALREESFFTIHAAIDALGKLGRSQAIAALRRVQLADLDGRLQKAAREAIESLTSGGSPTEQQRALRAQVEGLQNENRDMRSRLERLEAKLQLRPAVAPQRGARNGKRSPRGVTKRSG